MSNRLKTFVLAALFALVASLNGCAVGRRAYLAATHHTVRNMTDAMLPTIKAGQYVVVDATYYVTHPIQRFDIVLVRSPRGEKTDDGRETFYLERVIAVGGEKVEIRRGILLVNDAPLQETFQPIPHDEREAFGPFTIPQDEYFLLGDNRINSFDSRYWTRHSVANSLIGAKVTEIVSQ